MDAKFWTKKLKEAERELDAATRLSDICPEAHARQGALKRLEVAVQQST
jgi:hypothetical protein